MKLIYKRPRLVALLLTVHWLIIGVLSPLMARAGGAGGHSSSHSSSHSSGGGISFHSSSGYSGSGGGLSGLCCLLFFIALIIIIVVLVQRSNKINEGDTGGSALPSNEDADQLAANLAAIPGFQLEVFRQKVGDAFLKIQAAWSAQNLAGIRPFISDGIYQRFATQFRMMALLHQRNPLSNIRILDITPVALTLDGAYDVVQVRVEAVMDDSFVCDLDHSLDSEGDDPFVEYWSLIRKRQISTEGDIYQNKNCPSCGAPLPSDMGELCRCGYCQVMVNSGEFDWVLAEITQENYYGYNSVMARRVSPELSQAVADLTREAPDFAVQFIEDKASNAFMQIMSALATHNPAMVRRFVSDSALAAVTALIPQENIVFNRLYLNEAVLLDAARVESRHVVSVGLTVTLQRVQLGSGNGFRLLDDEEVSAGYVMVLERDANAVPSNGALYQHQCPSCGGAVGDTLDINCQYCAAPLNSLHNEWIVTRFDSCAIG